MGALNNEQNEAFLKNPRFLGMKFPELSKPETLEKVTLDKISYFQIYLGKMSKKTLSLLKGLLKLDP